MNIQKINDNKLQITFDTSFLEENNITLHSFLSNTSISQKFINELLNKTKEKFNISYDDSNIILELYYIDNEKFVINIENFVYNETNNDKTITKKLKIEYYTYTFISKKTFKEFLNFINHIPLSINYGNIKIYEFENKIVLIIHNTENNDSLTKIKNILPEFSNLISTSENLVYKIQECGTIIKN